MHMDVRKGRRKCKKNKTYIVLSLREAANLFIIYKLVTVCECGLIGLIFTRCTLNKIKKIYL